MIQPEIRTIDEKKLIGVHVTMSLQDNQTQILWRQLMPRRREIMHAVNNDLISLQVYPERYFNNFHPSTPFEKWAAVEVANFDHIPDGMETFILPAGLYAVFNYQGSSDDASIYEYIFGQWLPNSSYHLDNRPHFEVLGDKYRNKDAASEEMIFIPVSKKS